MMKLKYNNTFLIFPKKKKDLSYHLDWLQCSKTIKTNNNNNKQEAHGPRFAHLSDIATADMQMFPIIYAKIQP